MRKSISLLCSVSLLLAACGLGKNGPTNVERQVQQLKMSGKMKSPTAEYSALAWCDNSLIMVPQFPETMCEDASGCFFQIPEKNLQEALADGDKAVRAKEILLYDHGLKEKMVGYEGYEALDCVSDTVFLTVEAKTEEGMRAYLLKGTIDLEHSRIDLEPDKMAILKAQTNRRNSSYEAIMAKDGVVYAFYEQYNKNMNPDSYIYRFDYNLKELEPLDGFDLWYRLTDVGGFDKDGHLWMLNYNFPRSADKSEQNGAVDALAAKFGKGPSHQKSEVVERLVPFTFSTDKIAPDTLVPPIQLTLLEGNSRNWEGLAIWPDHGFFLVTDKFPGSILGFIKY